MDFRRTSHADERRRRVLIEETGLQLPAASPGSRTGGDLGGVSSEPVRTYTEAALPPHQARVVDLIPTRRWTFLLVAILVLAVAAGLEALHGYVAWGHTALQISQVPAVDLTAPGNVAAWFSSCLLLSAAGLGILTYLIRRHRADDYRGRYRMWYWVVPLMVLASMDQVADLQTSLRNALVVLAGIPDFADAAWIWSAVLAVVAAAVAFRLAIEMRACWPAVAGLVVALTCYGTRQAVALDWILPERGVYRDMSIAGLILLGNIHVFLALCLFARHVYRDALGEIEPRARSVKPRVRSRRARDASPADKPRSPVTPTPAATAGAGKDTKTRVDHTPSAPTPAATPQQVQLRTATDVPHSVTKLRGPLAAAAQRAAADTESDDEAGDAGLSKAERRRQRKLQRRENRQS